jgi:hypothetical protein
MSTNINKKFSELKDVRDGVFIDAVVQIVKEPFDLGDKYTLWVSDYTEHSSFYPYGLMGGNYTEREIAKSEWPGPYGKRSMQMTCFEPHASVIRDQDLSAGTWIALRNLQIKLGHNSANLEGYLREDRRAQGIKINITKLDHQNSETARPELKNALRRKRDYENSKKAELKSIIEAAEAGRKRKAQMDLDSKQQAKAPKNSKQKRNESRALKQALFNQQNGLVKDDGEPNNETEDDAPEDVNHQSKLNNYIPSPWAETT